MPTNLTFLYFWRLMTSHEIYMHRCLELAQLGAGNVAPNPMVGAVLVYEGRIIGEGYHQEYGKAHAEPNCIASVKDEDKHLVEKSTLYVSLEPCAHFGKTPPCADLIAKTKIPKAVIGCRDPFAQVNGKGIEKLKAAGVEVELGVLEEECKELNKRFFTFHTEHRPYVILKWAQTLDNKIANEDYSRILISNEHTNRIVHKWRSEEMAIAVGTNTALYDDPELTTRLSPGKSPVRIVVDMDLRLPKTLKLFNSKTPTIVFNTRQHSLPLEKISTEELNKIGTGHYQVTEDVSLVHQMMNALYRMNIKSVLIEGGSYLLQSFIDERIWDEARVITNEQLSIGTGLPAPVLDGGILQTSEPIFSDVIRTYKNTKTNS
jgi:diaminohydroxyphosphoribosylaminopyrimidine deaminase/5-amino-6-(5-phosphoribosylamino)uracil reductase